MKRLMLRFGVAAVLVCVVAGSLGASSGERAFVLLNKTGLTIDELYLSPSKEDRWGDDVLGVDVLANNQKAEISFSHPGDECRWDMKIVDEDGDDVVWTNLDLCSASEITLSYQGGSPTAQIK